MNKTAERMTLEHVTVKKAVEDCENYSIGQVELESETILDCVCHPSLMSQKQGGGDKVGQLRAQDSELQFKESI